MALVVRGEVGEEFDEEAGEREAAEMAKIIADFVDETPVRHDELPESDEEDEEDEEGEKIPRPRPPRERRRDFDRGDGRVYKHQIFFNGVAFKEAVLDHALRTGRNLKQYRYDIDKVGFKCVGSEDCAWQIYASSLPNDKLWKIMLFVENHSCVPNGECEMLKVPQIARLFVDKIREEPDYFMPMKIEETIKERWGITVSRPQCQSARNTVFKWLECEYDHQFSRLRDYAAELVHSNPDSTVEIETLTNAQGKEEFHRFYVCFDVLKRTWKETCRPLIGVDGCHVKHKIKGQLLVALGRDADNAIYPVAWSVVQIENNDNWLWFVRKVKEDLGLHDGDGFILISNRQKGLINVVYVELPKIEHRNCVRHIYANMKKLHGSKKEMKPLIWSLAWSYNEAELQERMDRIFNYDVGVYNTVMNTNSRSWCRCFYKKRNFCEDVENNSTESFNSTINKAREKPFVPMLETIARLAMARISKRSATSKGHKGKCTSYVTKFLAEEYEKAMECRVTASTNGMYEARLSVCAYRVSLDRRTCTCRKFEICGIPCEHAYGVILHKKVIAEDYVCHWFTTDTWRRTYNEGLVPVRGSRFWPSTSDPDVHIPPEPKKTGKKKLSKAEMARKKGVNESPTKKQPKHKKRIMHCGVCGQADHNSRFHKKDFTQASQGETSQANLSQAESSQTVVPL